MKEDGESEILETRDPLIVLNLEDTAGCAHQIVLYDSTQQEIDKALQKVEGKIGEQEKLALKRLIEKKINAVLLQQKNGKQPRVTKEIKHRAENLKLEKIRNEIEAHAKRPYVTTQMRKEMVVKGTQDQAFQRLWYNATEGAKKRQEEYDQIFKMTHPFKPVLVAKYQLDREKPGRGTYERLAFSASSFKHQPQQQEQELLAQKNHARKGSSSFRRSKQETLQHTRKRSEKLMNSMIKEIEKNDPKKGEYSAQELQDIKFQSAILKYYSGEEAKKASKLFGSALEKSSVPVHGRDVSPHKLLEERAASRSSSLKAKSREATKPALKSESRRWEDTVRYCPDPKSLVIPKRYKKLLGLE